MGKRWRKEEEEEEEREEKRKAADTCDMTLRSFTEWT